MHPTKEMRNAIRLTHTHCPSVPNRACKAPHATRPMPHQRDGWGEIAANLSLFAQAM